MSGLSVRTDCPLALMKSDSKVLDQGYELGLLVTKAGCPCLRWRRVVHHLVVLTNCVCRDRFAVVSSV